MDQNQCKCNNEIRRINCWYWVCASKFKWGCCNNWNEIKRSTFTGEVSYAETEVTLWGIEVAESIGHNSLIIESNSQELVDLCLNKKDNRK